VPPRPSVHPNIVTIYEINEAAGSLVSFVSFFRQTPADDSCSRLREILEKFIKRGLLVMDETTISE